jgi:hypothetical protein
MSCVSLARHTAFKKNTTVTECKQDAGRGSAGFQQPWCAAQCVTYLIIRNVDLLDHRDAVVRVV